MIFSKYHIKNMDGQTLMITMGGPGTGKITVVKAATNIVNEIIQHSTSVLCLVTTVTDDFVIYGANYHYVLSLPINCSFQDLKRVILKFLQYHLDEIILIIIDEIPTMVNKTLHQIDKRLRQASGKLWEEFVIFTVVLVGDLQQLPSVGEMAMYQPDYSKSSLAYYTF